MRLEPLETTKSDAIEEAEGLLLPEVEVAAGRSRFARLRLLAAPIIVFAGFVGLWYLLSWRFMPSLLCFLGDIIDCDAAPGRLRSIFFPHPHQVVEVALVEAANRGDLLSALWLDVRLALIGLGISIVIGVTVAIAMSQARWVENSFYPYAVFLQTVPILALVPLIGFSLGFGFKARLLVVIIISLFPIITNTLFGLKSAERGLHDLFSLHTTSRWVRLQKLMIPNSIPAMFTGFQISAGLSVIGAIVGDFFFGQGERGLGNLILIYTNRLRPEEMWGAVFLSTLLGLSVFIFFGWLRTRLTVDWHESAGAGI